jgi:hypothetical protein
MTVAKPNKPKIQKRTPGLVITPPAPRPASDDNPSAQLFREAREAMTAIESPSQDLSPSSNPIPPNPLSTSGGQTPTPSDPLSTRPIAPERDYNKRANSIERDALPSGMFPGASKKLYDALYLRTRGAVKPGRTLRATKKELADWSGVRNRKTIDSHLRYLETCGLVVRQWELGNNDGYLYEINLPEEIGLMDRGGQRGVSPLDPSDQNLDRGTDQNLDRGGQSQVVVLSTSSLESKTFKTNTERSDDDEAAASLIRAAKKVIQEITGKEATQAELEKIVEVFEVISLEGKIAAARTTVSSAGPFLAEHLRRRLFKKNKQEIAAETAKEEPVSAAVNAFDCPDCAGVGWYYPEGKEKGMAKCRHASLMSDK